MPGYLRYRILIDAMASFNQIAELAHSTRLVSNVSPPEAHALCILHPALKLYWVGAKFFRCTCRSWVFARQSRLQFLQHNTEESAILAGGGALAASKLGHLIWPHHAHIG